MKKTFSAFVVTLFIVLFNGCATKEPTQIADMTDYAQEATPYLDQVPKIDYYTQVLFNQEFDERYFKPWHIDAPFLNKKKSMWGNGYRHKKMYGDNHKPLSQYWYQKQIHNSNFNAFNQVKQKAITVRNSALRVFPTISKMFYNPKVAGQGFPFDYNQNSGIKINSPLHISHYSKDKAWAFVQSSFAAGWIKVDDIALVSSKVMKLFENGNYYIAVKDNFPIYKKGLFKEYIKLGTVFPKSKYKNRYLTISKGMSLKGYLTTIVIKNNTVDKKPIKLNKENVKQIFDELIREPYGWGELLNHRDCSALTRDFIAPFGIYLDRNSRAQIKTGTFHSLKKMNDQEKKDYIKQYATPFLSLIYLRGHIMLYIGEQNGEPLAFHNVWGVKTLNQQKQIDRFIIGQAVVTTLEPGKELHNYYAKKSILNKIIGISNIIEN